MNMENPLNIYSAIFVSQEDNRAIFQYKNGKVFRAHGDSPLLELSISKIVDETKNMIRYYNIIDGVKKWGIINIAGTSVIPAIYDYISPMIADNFFKVFIGDYSWEEDDDYTSDIFSEYIDPASWNGDYYRGALKEGKWGIVDSKNRILVPIEYQWVELIDDNTVCCNVGGSRIIKWFDGDEKENVLSIADGLWKVIYLSAHLRKLETKLGAYDEVMDIFKKEYSKIVVTGSEYRYHAHHWQKIQRVVTNNNVA